MTPTKRILFVHNNPARFIKLDRDSLARRYFLTELYEKNIKKLSPHKTFLQVSKHDMVFCWFASWHSLFPLIFARMLMKPSILVIGGYDIAKVGQIEYGHQSNLIKKWIPRLAIKMASVLTTFSFFCQNEAWTNIGISPREIHVIHLGIPDQFGASSTVNKEKMALTVGNIDRTNLKRKGHELFVRTARLLPHIKFILAGKWFDDSIIYLRNIASPNVYFTGWLDDQDLTNLYLRSSIYVQLSEHEGFGMSLGEAMLAKCIPVVTRVGALPEVVGDAGLYVNERDPNDIAKLISHALAEGNNLGISARTRILDNFPLEKRQNKLYNMIDTILGNSNE